MQKTYIILLLVIFSTVLKADISVFKPIVETIPITNNTNLTAETGGIINLISTDPDVTTWGICWNTSGSPTVADSKIEHTGTTRSTEFPETITGLNQQTVYYVRAYAINSEGTYYGQEESFTAIPTLSEWALIIFGILTASIGAFYVYRKLIV